MVFNSVVLPDPELPTRATSEPCFTSSDALETAKRDHAGSEGIIN